MLQENDIGIGFIEEAFEFGGGIVRRCARSLDRDAGEIARQEAQFFRELGGRRGEGEKAGGENQRKQEGGFLSHGFSAVMAMRKGAGSRLAERKSIELMT